MTCKEKQYFETSPLEPFHSKQAEGIFLYIIGCKKLYAFLCLNGSVQGMLRVLLKESLWMGLGDNDLIQKYFKYKLLSTLFPMW